MSLIQYEGGHPAYPVERYAEGSGAKSIRFSGQTIEGKESSPLFTQRHLEALAKHIGGLRDSGDHEGADAVHNMVLKLHGNPKFNEAKFNKASKKPS